MSEQSGASVGVHTTAMDGTPFRDEQTYVCRCGRRLTLTWSNCYLGNEFACDCGLAYGLAQEVVIYVRTH